MDTTTVLQSFTPKSPPLTGPGLSGPSPPPPRHKILLSRRHNHQYLRIHATDSGNSSSDTASSSTDAAPPPVVQPRITPPDAVEIRFRRGSRRRSRQVKQQQDGAGDGAAKKTPAQPKEWEAMSITEKAIELYAGEKGVLFWLNKFAYASIFIMIGAWIVFRFVGPALNLYQLDTPPLSPSSVLKG